MSGDDVMASMTGAAESRRAAARAFDSAIASGRSRQSARMLGLAAARRSQARGSGS